MVADREDIPGDDWVGYLNLVLQCEAAEIGGAEGCAAGEGDLRSVRTGEEEIDQGEGGGVGEE